MYWNLLWSSYQFLSHIAVGAQVLRFCSIRRFCIQHSTNVRPTSDLIIWQLRCIQCDVIICIYNINNISEFCIFFVVAEFTGTRCEINLCDLLTCENNGTCRTNGSSTACVCSGGFAGEYCEIDVNECMSNPCVHGVCVDIPDGYQCYCTPGERCCSNSWFMQ